MRCAGQCGRAGSYEMFGAYGDWTQAHVFCVVCQMVWVAAGLRVLDQQAVKRSAVLRFEKGGKGGQRKASSAVMPGALDVRIEVLTKEAGAALPCLGECGRLARYAMFGAEGNWGELRARCAACQWKWLVDRVWRLACPVAPKRAA